MSVTTSPELLYFENDGSTPNSPLPLLLHRGAFGEREEEGAAWLEATFTRNGWTNSWRNGVYPYHHYHTNTHEVLGVYRGTASLHLGGEAGAKLEVAAGDVIVIPAGVGHKRLEASDDFAVVGAYPDGMEPETLKEGDLSMEDALEQIRHVPLPKADPVRGGAGWQEIWK